MENNQSELILEMTAVSGELPSGQAIRLCNSEDYKRRVIATLKNDNLLNSFTKDGLKGYRLTGQAKKSLIAKNQQRFTFYLTGSTDTNKIRSEYSRRYRLHRISEVFISMYNAGISIFRDKKPDIFNNELIVPLPGQAKMFQDAAFYDSREVKDLGEETAKINNSRFVGVLLTKTDIYIVYNTGNAVMKWNYKSELRAKALISMYLCQKKLPGLYAKKDIKAIVMGDSIENRTRTIVASRKDAMLRKRQSFYLNQDSEGKPKISAGQKIEARIIAVSPKVVRVEAFGVECSITARDLSWDWLGDASERFSVGDTTLIRILDVNGESAEDLSIRADIKSVTPNTSLEKLKTCRIQGKYAGKITDVYRGVVFIRLNTGVNAIAHSCYDSRTPGKNDDISFVVTHIDEERSAAVGIITRIIKQNL